MCRRSQRYWTTLLHDTRVSLGRVVSETTGNGPRYHRLTPMQTLPDLRNFKLRRLRLTQVLKSVKKGTQIIRILQDAKNFFLRDWKRSETKMAEEYCCAITGGGGGQTAAETVFWSFSRSPVYTIAGRVYTQFLLQHNSTCAGPSKT